jgi:hypothetical protein
MKKSQKRQSSTKLARALTVSLSLAGLAGCVADATGDVEGQSDTLAGETMWMDCAKAGEFCAFSGTRSARYGSGSTWTYRTYTGGVQCAQSTFGGPAVTGAVCQFLMSVDEHTMDTGTTDPVVHDPGTHTGGTTGSTGSTMPYVDVNSIPMGDPGVSTVLVKPTTEKPTASDIGNFRTTCLYSHMNFDDAIVYPNQPGKAHLHTYFGNTGADAYSTQSSLKNTGNSTCRGGIANRSSYWAPAVIDANGRAVKPLGINVYYKTGYNGIAPSAVKVFPQGLRMIAGDAKSQSADTNPHGYWGCLNNYIGHPHTPPTCPVGDDVIMIVVFPQCWDGKNLDSADHKSHMAYPSGGRCPTTHPVAIPEITYNIRYKMPTTGGTKGWRLSSDMYDATKPGGYSAHADYFEAWDPTISSAFVKNCDNKQVDCHSHLLGDGRMIYNTRETQ